MKQKNRHMEEEMQQKAHEPVFDSHSNFSPHDVDHQNENQPIEKMDLVPAHHVERQDRNERDKENVPVQNFSSNNRLYREQKPSRDFEELERVKQENARNFTKNQWHEEAASSNWCEKNAFDSEVMRSQK